MQFRKSLKLVLAIAAALFLCSDSLAQEQTGSFTSIIRKGKKASSVPISDSTLKFEVILPGEKLATILVREGEMAKIGDLDKGYAFALVPVINTGKDSASFNIFRLTQDESGNESVREVERINVRLENPVTTNTEPPFRITLLSIEQPTSSLSPDKPEKTGASD